MQVFCFYEGNCEIGGLFADSAQSVVDFRQAQFEDWALGFAAVRTNCPQASFAEMLTQKYSELFAAEFTFFDESSWKEELIFGKQH